MGTADRLRDADVLWAHGHREGALLMALIAARARRVYPGLPDHRAFVSLLKSRHDWTVALEYRGQLWDVDELFYVWLRCELIHTAALPVDIRIDSTLSGLTLRAGGAPGYAVLVSPDWYPWFVEVAVS